MDEDRRRHARKVPDKFAFVQIEGDEVGKVLDVSEGGLSFCSFAPVPEYGPLYFWFSFNLKDRIEGMGELAWTDSSRRVGGLRFVQLSKSSREQIHTWLSRMPSQAVDVDFPPRVWPNGEPKRIGVGKSDRVARFVSKARTRHSSPSLNTWDREDLDVRSLRPPAPSDVGDRGDPKARSGHVSAFFDNWDRGDSEVSSPNYPASFDGRDRVNAKARSQHFLISLHDGQTAQPNAPFPALPGAESSGGLGGLVPAERYHSAKKRQLVRGVVLGVCVSVAVTVAAVKYSKRAHPANTVVASAQSSIAKNDIQVPPPTPQPKASPSSPAQNIFSPGEVNRRAVSRPASKPVAASYARSQSPFQTSGPSAASREARTPGQPALGSNPGTIKKSMTPAQLWGAVQAGNTRAAVVLAEDYIQGEGVPKNCQQARILLLMASEKRNAAAIKRLQQLDQDKDTCP